MLYIANVLENILLNKIKILCTKKTFHRFRTSPSGVCACIHAVMHACSTHTCTHSHTLGCSHFLLATLRLPTVSLYWALSQSRGAEHWATPFHAGFKWKSHFYPQPFHSTVLLSPNVLPLTCLVAINNTCSPHLPEHPCLVYAWKHEKVLLLAS